MTNTKTVVPHCTICGETNEDILYEMLFDEVPDVECVEKYTAFLVPKEDGIYFICEDCMKDFCPAEKN